METEECSTWRILKELNSPRARVDVAVPAWMTSAECRCVSHSSYRFLLHLNPKTPNYDDEASRRLTVPEIALLSANGRN
jgi:hypothetical protein